MPSITSFKPLNEPLKTLTYLLQSFQQGFSTHTAPSSTFPPPNCLSLLHDSSSLLHAQVTKLSLLLLNKPFTPSAIASIITSINSQILPGLMAANEICDARMYSQATHDEVHISLKDLTIAMIALAKQIPTNESEVERLEGESEIILQITGQVWKSCDRLKKIAELGIAGLALEKARAYHTLMKDALQEIEEWDPDDDDDFFGEADSDSDNEAKVNGRPSGASGEVNRDGVVSSNQQSDNDPPALDTISIQDTHALKAHVLEFSKHIRVVYPALIKGRIAPFPPFNRTSALSSLVSSPDIRTLDQLLQCLKRISEEMDELAGALYAEKAAEVHRYQMSMTALAQECVEYLKTDWQRNNQYDDWISAWTKKMEAINAKV
ncbi:MAG: hypothetical protein Q9174_006118 [Haloplaca sp. 1 TL-2023]